MFDSRHNNFPQPDRAVLYTRDTGDVRESFMKWDARDGVFVEDIYVYNSLNNNTHIYYGMSYMYGGYGSSIHN
jgi:hypothetical protein